METKSTDESKTKSTDESKTKSTDESKKKPVIKNSIEILNDLQTQLYYLRRIPLPIDVKKHYRTQLIKEHRDILCDDICEVTEYKY